MHRTSYTYFRSNIPKEFCHENDIPHLQKLHEQIRHNKFGVYELMGAYRAYMAALVGKDELKGIQELMGEKELTIEEATFSQEIKRLIDEERVAINAILDYINVEFGNHYGLALMYFRRNKERFLLSDEIVATLETAIQEILHAGKGYIERL